MEPICGTDVRSALRVLHDGFAFIGITEAWEESVAEFHGRFMPGAAAASDSELNGEGHTSGDGPPAPPHSRSAGLDTLEDDYAIQNSNTVDVDMTCDHLWFPDVEERRVVERDPDL